MGLSRSSAGLRLGPATIALGVVATVATAGAVAVEYGRVWNRGSAPLPAEADDPLRAAADAAVETAEVARVGYQEGSSRENSLFNLSVSFATTFILTRAITTVLRERSSFGPFHDLTVGRRHIHHFVPGIVLAFAAGGAAIVLRDEHADPWLAIPFGAGLGLTLDESALLLELDDVYWSDEGILSVQIGLATAAILSALALAGRLVRRGEAVVLEDPRDTGLRRRSTDAAPPRPPSR